VEGHELYVTASVGVSLYPAHGQTAAEILRRADSAMYRVKGQGKNNYYFFSPEINEDEQKNLWLVTQLHKALEYSELILYYQPQLNLANGLISGVEALIRWNHRELGLVSPGNFIPIAEETGLIIPIGAWVMEQSCLQAKRWQTQGYKPMRMSVNVSAIQFNRDDFVELVVQSLEKSDLDPIWLELELTEGLLFGNTQATIAKLEQLKQLGVSLAIDDFGTGYSSLHYLQQLPIDTLKIDQFFVRSLTDDRLESSKGLALIKTIINLGHNLNMTIIAEGVETNSQLEYLKELSCDEIQGYLFSKPRSVPEFETFMSESSILGLVRKEKRYEKVT
jgi:EAL domain-containing protein (putative c-di-GMP-specific phosphodiesterase class I)